MYMLPVKNQEISGQGTPEYWVPGFLYTKGKEDKGGTFSYSSESSKHHFQTVYWTALIYAQGISKKNS